MLDSVDFTSLNYNIVGEIPYIFSKTLSYVKKNKSNSFLELFGMQVAITRIFLELQFRISIHIRIQFYFSWRITT